MLPSLAHWTFTAQSACRLFLVFTGVLAIVGCSSVYYDAMETLGFEKRDILVDRVEEARDSQDNAQQTFRSALEQFQSVVDTPDTPLQEKYESVRDAYEDSEASAENVRERIDKVEDVAADLFEEWEEELDLYESPSLRQASREKLRDTQRHYEQLIARMHEAEGRMEPVLQAFQDQMLFLKHNLNAQAIASLESELGRIRQDVDTLIRQMEDSIAESDAFIQRFQTTQ